MGRTGKLITGLIFFIIGIFIAYYAYANNLIDLILIIGGIIAFFGIVLIFMFVVDSSADETRSMIKDYVEKKSNIDLSEINIPKAKPDTPVNEPNRPLRVRREFDDYNQEFYDDDEMIYVDHDDDYQEEYDPSTILKPRNLEEETQNFGNDLEFIPHYDRPIKITRAPKKREVSFFANEDEYLVDSIEDKSESIRQALYDEPEEIIPDLRAPQQKPARDIKIDINNPDSLPIPKLLNSFIVSNDEIITTDVAFERLTENIRKEVMLEIPSLNDLSDRFLSHIPTIYSRIIIQDFDVSDIGYMILVASLLKQGVQIKTMSSVNTVNFIVDDATALILSNGRGGTDIEYGAIYRDVGALSEIRAAFEKSWELAKDLDQDIILRYMEAEA